MLTRRLHRLSQTVKVSWYSNSDSNAGVSYPGNGNSDGVDGGNNIIGDDGNNEDNGDSNNGDDNGVDDLSLREQIAEGGNIGEDVSELLKVFFKIIMIILFVCLFIDILVYIIFFSLFFPNPRMTWMRLICLMMMELTIHPVIRIVRNIFIQANMVHILVRLQWRHFQSFFA